MIIAEKLIVVADDYDSAAEMMAHLLELELTCKVLPAKDGAEAPAIANERRPDVVLLDIDMPYIGGIEAARMLREKFPEGPPLIIGMTGGVHLDAAKESGYFHHVFGKPFNVHDLVKLIIAEG